MDAPMDAPMDAIEANDNGLELRGEQHRKINVRGT